MSPLSWPFPHKPSGIWLWFEELNGFRNLVLKCFNFPQSANLQELERICGLGWDGKLPGLTYNLNSDITWNLVC